MAKLPNPDEIYGRFNLPPQDLDLLGFCAGKKAGQVDQWIKQLRHTQIGKTASLLYQAVPQVAHLRTDPKTRFEMLELLWPVTQQAIQGLSRDFLNQPLVLPEPAQKAALVAQALQKNLVDGYTLCTLDLHRQKLSRHANRELLVSALYRAVTGIGLLMLRNHQLYTQIPAGHWTRIHGLYAIAMHYELHEHLVKIEHSPTDPRNVQDAWLHASGLACSRLNQLVQQDISIAFSTLAAWSCHIQIRPGITADQRNLYVVDLESDQPPVIKARHAAAKNHHLTFELDFQRLVNQVSKMSDSADMPDDQFLQGTLNRPPGLHESLTQHLLTSWNTAPQRHQDRQQTNHTIEICAGLTDCHFQMTHETPFEEFLQGHSRGGHDDVQMLLKRASRSPESDAPKARRQCIHNLTVQNTSAGGFCLLWSGELPSKLEAGELVALRYPGRETWDLCAVRWIRQLKGASQLGVQLIARKAEPCAVAITYDLGGFSDYQRAIRITSPAISGQPPSLLTFAVPFQAGLRIKLKEAQRETDVRLKQCIYSTGKIKLFTYDVLSAE